MRILPVVGRELRVIARRPSAYWVRSVAALAAFLVMGYVALMSATGSPTSVQGRSLFGLLSLIAFIYCALAGVRGTSDALSAEKREGTLGLLFLTDLKGYDVVLGKLVSVSMNSVYAMLSIAPLLALAFMLGGTTVSQFLLMIVFLLNTLFFSLAVGIFISTFSHQERAAMGGTIAIIFVSLTMPYAIATAHAFGNLEIWEVQDPGFLLTSPAFAFFAIKDANLARIYLDEILLSFAFTHLAAWLCLVVSSACIAQRAHADAPEGRLSSWFTRLRQDWAYGKAERRRAIRGALLDRNAFAWLAGRDRLKQRYAWIFLILLGGLWTLGRWKAREITEEWPFALFSLWFLHLFFKVWVSSEVAARFIEDRRNNGLELLLTTPLKLVEFAHGEMLALIRQFGAPIAAIVALDLFAGWRATDSSSYLLRSPSPMQFFIAGLVHLAFDLYAIVWVTIWRSLHLRGTNRTISQTLFLIVLLPVLGWFVMWQASWVAQAASRRGGEASVANVFWMWTYLCVVYDVALALIARYAFFRDFREVATKTFDKPTPFQWKFWRNRGAAKTPLPIVPPRKRRFRHLRRIAFAAAILLVCAHVATTIRRNHLQKAIDARMAALRDSGLPAEVSALPAWRPTPNAGQSASLVLRQASSEFGRTTQPIRLTELEGQWHSRKKLRADLKQSAIEWMQANTNIFALLAQAAHRKPGAPSYDEQFRGPIAADDLARILQLKARVEMEDDPAAAAKTITMLLHYIGLLQGEPFGGFNGTRKALQYASELMERAAVEGGYSPELWREWRAILSQFDPVGTFRTNLIIERARGLDTFSWPVEMLYQRFGNPMSSFPALFYSAWSIRRLVGQDKVEVIEYLDHMADYISNADRPFWEVRNGRPKLNWRQPSLGTGTFIAPQIMPAFDWMFSAATESVAYQRILMTAADVEIFRAAHGLLPGELSDLPSLPRLDPFNGQPLHYMRRPNGYSIYSVGEDMTDNGGVGYAGRQAGDTAFHCGTPPERQRIDKNPLTTR